MSIDPNVGALKEYLTDITTSHTYNKVKDEVYIISAEDYKVIQMKKQFDDWKKLNKK